VILKFQLKQELQQNNTLMGSAKMQSAAHPAYTHHSAIVANTTRWWYWLLWHGSRHCVDVCVGYCLRAGRKIFNFHFAPKHGSCACIWLFVFVQQRNDGVLVLVPEKVQNKKMLMGTIKSRYWQRKSVASQGICSFVSPAKIRILIHFIPCLCTRSIQLIFALRYRMTF